MLESLLGFEFFLRLESMLEALLLGNVVLVVVAVLFIQLAVLLAEIVLSWRD